VPRPGSLSSERNGDEEDDDPTGTAWLAATLLAEATNGVWVRVRLLTDIDP
jgi:DTW domain-containing protein YfiP